ncbi:hypothetical protein AAE478_003063 [Parahypoxylon ruwenzoriense]
MRGTPADLEYPRARRPFRPFSEDLRAAVEHRGNHVAFLAIIPAARRGPGVLMSGGNGQHQRQNARPSEIPAIVYACMSISIASPGGLVILDRIWSPQYDIDGAPNTVVNAS